jgi:nucleoid DNA-binding protein
VGAAGLLYRAPLALKLTAAPNQPFLKIGKDPQPMNYDQMVNAVARRLYGKSRREVREVLDVLFDLWREELQQPDASLYIRHLGRLYVEQQQLRSSGIIQTTLQAKQGVNAPRQLARLYFRFTPTDQLRRAVLNARQGAQPHE